MVDQQEITEVLTDLRWLNNCTCSELPIEAYFVVPGQMIAPEALNQARRCPSRRQDVIFAYGRKIKPGYIGGLSSGQRQSMTLDQALEFIKTDPPTDEIDDDAQPDSSRVAAGSVSASV